jgi:hypothetical protein
MTERHLWEVDHPYYCTEGNYYSNGCHSTYDSWADFVEEANGWDLDMNLLFRWDWRKPEEGPGRR